MKTIAITIGKMVQSIASRYNTKLARVAFFLIVFSILCFQASAKSKFFYSYKIQENSWISITGSTNVNTFECMSVTTYPLSRLVVIHDTTKNVLEFNNASMLLEITGFNCNNQLMSREMHATLGAYKNPCIIIKLLSVEAVDDNPVSINYGRFRAKVAITINGVTRENSVNVNWNSGFNYSYTLNGMKELSMTDFSISPPTKAMGMVRVDDKIVIHFNLGIQVSLLANN